MSASKPSAERSGYGGVTHGRAGGRRGHPAVSPQRFLQPVRSLDQRDRVLELLYFLPSVRKGDDKFVIVTVHLTTDFVEQPRCLLLEEPDHGRPSIVGSFDGI